MPIILKCQDCGRTTQSDDGEPETCPECEGTMAPPPKKKYQAKSTPLEEEPRGKKKPAADERPKKKPAPRDEDDEDEAPRPKKKAARAADDDKDEDVDPADVKCDGKVAASLDLNPGFKSRALMKQVAKELSRTEVLHWAGRMCPEIVERQAFWSRIIGAGVAAAGGLFCAIFFSVAPWFVGLIPVVFVLVGLGIAIFGPGAGREGEQEGREHERGAEPEHGTLLGGRAKPR